MSGLPSMRQSFPQPLLEAAEQAWRASVQKTNKLSVQHQDISRTLWKLGVAHTSEHLTPDGLFCIDICLNGTNVSPQQRPLVTWIGLPTQRMHFCAQHPNFAKG